MDTILGFLLSTWGVIDTTLSWSIQNPLAGYFWGTVGLAVLNWVVKITPTKIDDSLLDILCRAFAQAMSKMTESKRSPK